MYPHITCLVGATCLVTAMVALAGCLTPPPSPPPAETGRFYPVQLHLHGSMSEGDASMRAHNVMAHELGTVDALWWTDHDWRIAGHGHLPGFDFDVSHQDFPIPERGTRQSRGHRLAGVEWEDEADEGIEESRAALTEEVVAMGTRALAISARSKSTTREWQWAGIRIVNRSGRLKASLAADVVVELLVHPRDAPSADARPLARFELSYQGHTLSELAYVLGAEGDPWFEDTPDRRVGYVPIEARPGEWTKLVMNVTRDVRQFDLGGWDNSLRKIRVGSQVRRGAQSRIVVDHLRVWRHRTGTEVLDRAEQIASGLAEEHGLVNLVGLEISYADHMNAYLPRAELPDFELYPNGMTPEEIVPWVHARGGVVSYNHVFGALKSELGQYRFRTSRLLLNRAFGADLLEVGYPHRVLPLENHLAVWDQLSSSQVFIGGIGTSDSHSHTRGWKGGNNYVTWVWSRSSEKADLLEALRSRHAFFGDPVRFRGELRLRTADGIPMGRVVRAGGDHQDVVLEITELPERATVKWIEQGRVVRVLEPPAGDFSETFQVDTSTYRYVRAELWRGKRGLVFSNCLYFLPE